MSKNIIWWVIELAIWYLFFYAVLFSIKNPINIGWMALIVTLLASLGLFASPLTRHLSIWNKVLDKIIRKEEKNTRAEGMVRIRDLGDDYFVLDQKNYCITGEKTKKKFRLGDQVKFKITNTDIEGKSIDCILV